MEAFDGQAGKDAANRVEALEFIVSVVSLMKKHERFGRVLGMSVIEINRLKEKYGISAAEIRKGVLG